MSLVCAAAFAQSADESRQLAEGLNLRALGRYAEARKAFTALLRESEQRGSGGVFISRVLDDLAGVEQDLGNFNEAERLLTRSLATLRNPEVESHLAELYLEEGRTRDADPLFRHALQSFQDALQPDPSNHAVALAGLALVYKNSGKFSRAEALLRQSVAMLEEHLGPDDPMLSIPLLPLGTTLTREGKYKEALAVTERTWRIMGGNPRVGEPDRINTMSSLGILYSQTGQFREAEFYGREAVKKAEAFYGADNPRLGWQLANFAIILKRMGRKAEAKEEQQSSAAILERHKKANPVSATVNVNALR